MAAAAASAACPTATVRILGPARADGGGTTGGTSASIVGTWRNLRTAQTTDGDTAVTDTRWTFTAGGSCSRTVIQTLVNAGIQDTTIRNCTYVFTGTSVTITFEGSSVASEFSVAFSGADLLLDGFRFTRIA